MLAWIELLVTKLVNVTLKYGVIGLGISMFLESIGIPATSVILELTSGTLIATGKTTFLEAVIISTAGLTLGSIFSYGIGYYGVHLLAKRWPSFLEKAQNSRARHLLVKHGEIAILFAQLFGTARTWVSLPAGIMGIGFARFVLYTTIGGAIYCAGAIGLSIVLTDIVKIYYRYIPSYLHAPAAIGLLISIIAFITWIKKRKSRKEFN